MCPNNPIGTVDLYLVTHHGLDPSGSPALVHGAAAARGDHAERHAQRRRRPGDADHAVVAGLEDIWQLHWSYGAGIEQNSAGVFIANVDDNATIAGILTAPPRRAGQGAVRDRVRGRGPPPAGAPGAGTRRPPPAGHRLRRRQLARPPAVRAGAAAAAGAAGPPPAVPPQGSLARGGGRGNAAAAHTPAYLIKISARPDGSFTVTNSRNGFTKTYAARPRAK